jgi:hypothetical protein
MKKMLIFLLFLIPLVYAEDLDTKKIVLDAKADDFVMQMNSVIDFSNSKNISAEQLTTIRNTFMATIQAALEATNQDDFYKRYRGAKQVSQQFKDITKTTFNSTKEELKSFVKNKKISSEKYAKAEELLKHKIEVIFVQRIEQLNTSIAQQEALGKDPKLQKILLAEFQEKLSELNETKIAFSTEVKNEGEFISSAMNVINTIKNKLMGEKSE